VDVHPVDGEGLQAPHLHVLRGAAALREREVLECREAVRAVAAAAGRAGGGGGVAPADGVPRQGAVGRAENFSPATIGGSGCEEGRERMLCQRCDGRRR